jgi:hypothetical protein
LPELPALPPPAVERLAEAAVQLLEVGWDAEPGGGGVVIGGRPRWLLLLQKQCGVLVRIGRQWQLCWEVVVARERSRPPGHDQPPQQQQLQELPQQPPPEQAQTPRPAQPQQQVPGDSRPLSSLSDVPGSDFFSFSALQQALSASLPPAALADCWAAATPDDASVCLGVLHLLPSTAQLAAAKRRPALLYSLLHDTAAALAQWQQGCDTAAAGGAVQRSWAGAGGGGEAAALGAAAALPAPPSGTAEQRWQWQQAMVRLVLHQEVLRVWDWCAWLLGVAV